MDNNNSLVLHIGHQLDEKLKTEDFLTLGNNVLMGIHIPTFLQEFMFPSSLTTDIAQNTIRKSSLSQIYTISNITRETLTFLKKKDQ